MEPDYRKLELWLLGDGCEPANLEIFDLRKWTDRFLGMNALHWAVAEDKVATIPEFLRLGVPICARDFSGESPLTLAVRKCHHEAARLLFEHGKKCRTDKYGRFPVHWAIECPTGECVRIACRHPGVNHRDRRKETPLHLCAHQGSGAAALALVENGADLSLECKNGLTAFHWACLYGNLAVIEVLISAGASPTSGDSVGRTPLYFAVLGDRPLAIHWLLELGVARDNVVPSNGALSMYELATTFGTTALLRDS